MKVITFSRTFPSTHPRKGEPTLFVEKIWQGLNTFPLTVSEIVADADPRLEEQLKNHFTKVYDPKWHTIRKGNRWKVGDWFHPRVWSGKPYRSKQVDISIPIEIKKIWEFEMDLNGVYSLDGKYLNNDLYEEFALNDGLSEEDMQFWFMPNYNKPKQFKGQVICWSEKINYDEPV
jgi:hypothetical protein